MNEYKRLTKKGLDWESDVQCDDEKIYNRLAELEDKIENGTLIELTCKVGDTVYQTEGVRVYESKIKGLIYDKGIYYDCGYFAFDETAIGEVVFLTKAEAEAKLRELEFKKRVDCGNSAIVED